MENTNCKRKQSKPNSLSNLRAKSTAHLVLTISKDLIQKKNHDRTKNEISMGDDFESKKNLLETYLEKVVQNRQSNNSLLGPISIVSADDQYTKIQISSDKSDYQIETIKELSAENFRLTLRVDALSSQKLVLESTNSKLSQEKQSLESTLTGKNAELISLNQLVNNLRTKLYEISSKNVELLPPVGSLREKRVIHIKFINKFVT